MSAAQHTPGHRLELSKRGAQSGFWHGRCACGWSYPGAFAKTQATVRASHERHVAAIAKATGSAA